MIVNCPTNISEWTKNITPPTFSNTYDEQTKTNSLSYKGGSGYERLYYPIQTTASRTITFSIKFCSPSGYSCSYGDTQVYFAITTDEPTGKNPIKEHNIVASVPMDGTASNTPVLYTVSYTPSSSSTIYLVIDMGYMVDGVDTTLIYQDISASSGMWYVADGKLAHDNLSEPLTGNYIQPPYPPFWWYVNDGNLTHDGLPEPISAIMSEPYPPFWWYVENGRLTHVGLPEKILVGAFLGCTNLRRVIIPRSVRYIGEYTFRNTQITQVTINSDCTYSDTSFPENCTVDFYNN